MSLDRETLVLLKKLGMEVDPDNLYDNTNPWESLKYLGKKVSLWVDMNISPDGTTDASIGMYRVQGTEAEVVVKLVQAIAKMEGIV